jgi:hypothetical protein
MKLFGYRWPLVLWSSYDRLETENHSLKRHLLGAEGADQARLLLARLADADKATEGGLRSPEPPGGQAMTLPPFPPA